MTKSTWELVYATDYSALYRDASGEHDPELIVAQGDLDETDDEQDIEAVIAHVYRVRLERLKVSDPSGELRAIADDAISMGDHEGAARIEAEIWAAPHHLISLAWDPSWNQNALPSGRDEWFVDDLGKVASYTDATREDLERALCSDDPATLAMVYEAIGDYHGFKTSTQNQASGLLTSSRSGPNVANVSTQASARSSRKATSRVRSGLTLWCMSTMTIVRATSPARTAMRMTRTCARAKRR
jgi:hypothetical protein